MYLILRFHLAFSQITYGIIDIYLIDNRPVYLQSLADKNFLDNLLDGAGNFKSWNELKAEFNLADNLYFSWMQLINSIPLNWRNIIKNNCSSTNLLLLKGYLRYKIITSQNVSSEAQVKNFFVS